MLSLYQIPVPTADNAGVPYHPVKLRAFRYDLGRLCGGYTQLARADGAWHDPEDSKVYIDVVIPFQFAASEDAAAEIVAAFFRHFPDQKCAMLAKLGEVAFHNNPAQADIPMEA